VSWNKLDVPTETVSQAFTVDPSTPATLYLAADEGVLQSKDSGASWAVIHEPLGKQPQVMAVDPTSSSTLYVGTMTDLYKSTDGGVNWRVVYSHVNSSSQALAFDLTSPSIVYFAVNSANATGKDGVLLRSMDGGETWDEIDTIGYDVLDMAVDPAAPSRLYLAGPKGILVFPVEK